MNLNVFDILHKSGQLLPLTPFERALLQFFKGMALTCLAAIVPVLGPPLLHFAETGVWTGATNVFITALVALIGGVFAFLSKYYNAQRDPLLALFFNSIETFVQQAQTDPALQDHLTQVANRILHSTTIPLPAATNPDPTPLHPSLMQPLPPSA